MQWDVPPCRTAKDAGPARGLGWRHHAHLGRLRLLVHLLELQHQQGTMSAWPAGSARCMRQPNLLRNVDTGLLPERAHNVAGARPALGALGAADRQLRPTNGPPPIKPRPFSSGMRARSEALGRTWLSLLVRSTGVSAKWTSGVVGDADCGDRGPALAAAGTASLLLPADGPGMVAAAAAAGFRPVSVGLLVRATSGGAFPAAGAVLSEARRPAAPPQTTTVLRCQRISHASTRSGA